MFVSMNTCGDWAPTEECCLCRKSICFSVWVEQIRQVHKSKSHTKHSYSNNAYITIYVQGLFEVAAGLGYAVGPPLGGLLYEVL